MGGSYYCPSSVSFYHVANGSVGSKYVLSLIPKYSDVCVLPPVMGPMWPWVGWSCGKTGNGWMNNAFLPTGNECIMHYFVESHFIWSSPPGNSVPPERILAESHQKPWKQGAIRSILSYSFIHYWSLHVLLARSTPTMSPTTSPVYIIYFSLSHEKLSCSSAQENKIFVNVVCLPCGDCSAYKTAWEAADESCKVHESWVGIHIRFLISIYRCALPILCP